MKLSGNFLYSPVSAPIRDGLPIAFAFTPDQRNLHLAAGSAAKINPADILLPLDQGRPGLLDAVRRGGVEFDARALVADERLVLVHGDVFIGTDGRHLRNWLRRRPPCSAAGVFGLFRGDREVKFPVIEHLRPQAAIDEWRQCVR